MLNKLIQLILNLFRRRTAEEQDPDVILEISLQDYLTSSGKYPERASSRDCTDEVIMNARLLLSRVNPLLRELGVLPVTVSSGFRTQAANQAAGGSLQSGHLSGKAVDIADPTGDLDKLVVTKQDLLHKYDLYLEHPDRTAGWTHLDIKPRTVRIFKP